MTPHVPTPPHLSAQPLFPDPETAESFRPDFPDGFSIAAYQEWVLGKSGEPIMYYRGWLFKDRDKSSVDEIASFFRYAARKNLVILFQYKFGRFDYGYYAVHSK